MTEPAAGFALRRRRRALLLACAQFSDPALPPLRSPRRDAEVLGATLAAPVGPGYDVTEEIDSTAHEARLAIEEFFSTARPTDVHLLYVSCHGIQDQRGELYFAFSDTQRERPAATAVAADWVREQIRASRSRTTIVLVDCCFSGAFLRGMRARDSGDANLGSLVRDLPSGTGVAVLTASGETEFSLEEVADRAAAAARPSYFTEAVVAGIGTGAADRDGDGRITVDELYDYVYRRIVEGPSPQRPRKMGHTEGEVVIAEVGRRFPEPPLPPKPSIGDATAVIAPETPLVPWPPLPLTTSYPQHRKPRSVEPVAAKSRPRPPDSLPSRPPPRPPSAPIGVDDAPRPPSRRWRTAAVAGLATVLVAGGVVYVATRDQVALPTVTSSPVCGRKLGLLNGMIERYPEVGTAMQRGADLAVREHNRATPGCPVGLATEAKADLAGIQGAAAGIAADPTVIGVVEAAQSDQVEAVQPIFHQAGLAVITPTATESSLSRRGWTTFFRTVASNTAQVSGDARYLTQVLGATAVYIVGEDTPIARELTSAMRDQLQSVAVGPTLVPVDTGKLSGLVSQIKASGAGFVYVAGPGKLAGRLGHRLRAAGNAARLVMAQAWPCRQKRGGAAYADDNVVAGAVYTCTCLPTEQLPDDFRSRYRDAYGTEPLGYSAMAYDAANILLAALTAGAASRAATRAHVAGYSGEGVGGRYRFTATGELEASTINRWAYTVRDGVPEVKPIR
jgi:ABC-type branched-subunit amino acid transport system substrate-binding protein